MTSNEIRQVIGMKPSDDPRADELRNKNLSAPSEDKVPNSEVQLNDENEEASDLDGKISKQNRRSKEEIQNE